MEYSLSFSKTIKSHQLLTTPIISGHNLAVKTHRRADVKINTGACSQRLAAVVASHRESSSLNTPIEPRSAPGKLLSGVLQNRRESFHGAVADQLKQLADDRDSACERMLTSSGSSEAGLYRRIAEVQNNECQIAVEDVMYMLILHSFAKINVYMVPNLSKCIYNNRLEIWHSNFFELESIHDLEVLELVREHVTNLTGLTAISSVRDEWAPTKISRIQLFNIYNASILYGYFLKSACLRHHMESSLSLSHQDLHLNQKFSLRRLKDLVQEGIAGRRIMALGQVSNSEVMESEKLRCYVMGFDPESLQRCSKLKSMEASTLVEKHTWALFGNGERGSIDTDEVIDTSFGSLKTLILEAAAFGTFLWDAEKYVDTVYKLKDT